MFARSIFWKRFKKLVFGCFAICFGVITCFILGSWTYNPSTNTVSSDNLFNSSNYNNTINGVEININNNVCILNGTSSNGFYQIIGHITLSPGSYHYRQYSTNENYDLTNVRYGLNGGGFTLDVPSTSVVLNQTTTINIVIWVSTSNMVFDNLNLTYMLNTGSDDKPYEPYGIWYSGDEYNEVLRDYFTLLNEYNNLQLQYRNVMQQLNASFDVGQYTLSVAKQGSYQNQWNFIDETTLTNTDYIDSLGYLDVSSIYDTYIDGNINAILVHLDNPVNVYNYDLMFNNFNLGDNINLLIKLNVNGTEVTNLYSLVSTNVNANETYTLSNFIKYQDSSIGILTNYTYQDFAIVWTNVGNSLSNVKLNGQGDYNLGFVNGLAQNNKDFVDLQNDYNDLSNNYEALSSRYDALEDQYTSLASRNLEFSMRNLVWYIASTPFESFKSIWSVDFLGLNIASFFTGLFSVFIIVWILKKIF